MKGISEVELGIALCIMELGKMEAELGHEVRRSPIFHATANAYRLAAVRMMGLLVGNWVMPAPENVDHSSPDGMLEEVRAHHGGITEAELAEAGRLIELARAPA